ncbi:MAG: hypothetical protein R3B74_01135 [Nitrospirales bacterium]|nr:hypothetical protein [Nitrospirales bacterium]
MDFEPYLLREPITFWRASASWGHSGDSQSFTKRLITEAKVAVVPGNAFYYQAEDLGLRLVRFAFAKTSPVLQDAGKKLGKAFQSS